MEVSMVSDEQPVPVEDGKGDEEQATTRYLDLDGDGVPDAVETVSIDVDCSSPGGAVTVEIVDEVDAEIDDDGTPHRVAIDRIVVSEE
jgi:hypothetical protein